MSPREINLLLRITGWTDEKLTEHNYDHEACDDCCYKWGRDSAFEELRDYISELMEEVK